MAQRHADPYLDDLGYPIVRHRYIGGSHLGGWHEARRTRSRPKLGTAAWALCSVPAAWLMLLLALGVPAPARPGFTVPQLVTSPPPEQPAAIRPEPDREPPRPSRSGRQAPSAEPATSPAQPADPGVPPAGQAAPPTQAPMTAPSTATPAKCSPATPTQAPTADPTKAPKAPKVVVVKATEPATPQASPPASPRSVVVVILGSNGEVTVPTPPIAQPRREARPRRG